MGGGEDRPDRSEASQGQNPITAEVEMTPSQVSGVAPHLTARAIVDHDGYPVVIPAAAPAGVHGDRSSAFV